MTVFAAAMDRIFTSPAMAVQAVWISARTSEERNIRVIRKAPDRIAEFGSARLLSDTTTIDVRVADLPEPRPGDLILLGTESLVLQAEPVRDSDRLIWTLDLRPT